MAYSSETQGFRIRRSWKNHSILLVQMVRLYEKTEDDKKSLKSY